MSESNIDSDDRFCDSALLAFPRHQQEDDPMSKSTMTRRALVAGAATMPMFAAPALPAQISTVEDDRELISLGRDLEALWRTCCHIEMASPWDDRLEKMFDECNLIVEEIDLRPALTLAGLRTKAFGVLFCQCGQNPIRLHEDQTTDQRLAQSIIYGLLDPEVVAEFGRYNQTTQEAVEASPEKAVQS
jgi:hypothetical protein